MGKTNLALFEIRTETEFIVFSAPQDETPGETQKLRGQVVIMPREDITVKNFTINFHGRLKTWHILTSDEVRNGPIPRDYPLTSSRIPIDQTIELKDKNGIKPKTLGAQNYAFPFEFDLKSSLPESVEGLANSFVAYRLHVNLERGYFNKSLSAMKPIRLIRSPPLHMLNLEQPWTLTGTWPEKIKYELSTSSNTVVFGDSVTVGFKLTPLVEKLKIGKIMFTIEETLFVLTSPPRPHYSGPDSPDMWEHPASEIYRETVQPPEQCDETDEETGEGTKKFSITFKLPTSLKQCRQTVEKGEFIRVKHKAFYSVAIHNVDGHISELRAPQPIKIRFSPRNLSIENDTVTSTQPPSSRVQGQTVLDEERAIPPLYEHHRSDKLVNPFAGIDSRGYLTPGAQSGVATPHFYFSRRESADEFFRADSSAPSANAIASRLQQLQMTQRDGSGEPEPNEDQTGSQQDDTETNRRSTEPDLASLSRLTSYNTARRVPAPTFYGDGPPAYDAALNDPSASQQQQ